MSAEAYIGVPGDVIHAQDADVQGCKAGGLPWLWPGVQKDALNAASKCEFCGAARSLVVQVHAPLPSKTPSDRILLLFVCTSDACCGAPHAFVAVRCQKHAAADQTNAPQQDSPKSTEGWGAVTWGATATASPGQQPDSGLDSGIDFGDLMADMDKLALPSAPSQPPAAAPAPRAETTKPPPHDDIVVTGTAPALPEFWIGFRRVDDSGAAGRSDDAHIQQLLEQYREGAVSTAEASSASAPSGEQYEKTDPHTKFLEKLAQHPSQCVRYEWGMNFIWPAKDMPQAECCSHCGAARVPELQVLSPMWHFMEDAATWYDGISYSPPDRLDARVLSSSTWDWEAVLIFTCSESCQVGGNDLCIAVEQVAAYNLATLPGHLCDLSQIERMSAALPSGSELDGGEPSGTALAGAAAAEEGHDSIAPGSQPKEE